MERRGTGYGDRVDAAPRVWEAVRRALGRVFAQTNVQGLSEAQRTLSSRVVFSSAVAPPVIGAGPQEKGWQPSSSALAVAIPQATAGAQNGDLLPSVRLSTGNRALALPECFGMPPLVSVAECRVETLRLTWPVESAGLPETFLQLPPSPVRVQSRPLLSAPGRTAPADLHIRAPKSAAVRIPRLPPPPVRWGGDALLSRISLTRRCREAPADVPPALAFEGERRRLAETVNLPPEAVRLLGIYPHVPILAISRIVVEEEGRLLRLWLKPDILRGKGGNRLITLLVGRRLSDGKMLQAAL